ncbi:hypothetical protein [Burkholderia lata]|uniref:hypothetical protein n=1 Tax=Burkholderia lata (strain ATCC 17760 / DSM 23089 / LMG 22485 / NCIMB 9086 / R18194 / 383) TaxID=482957 RepID=UPI000A99C79E|nr:hypothetical protein [Burkholderia lata]
MHLNRYSTIRYVYKPAISELSFTLDFLFNFRRPLFRVKTSGLECVLANKKRFAGKRVDVVRNAFRPVDRGFSPIAAGKNASRTLPIDPVFSRASEKTGSNIHGASKF